ncbi:fasciclin-like arabinogalactan protein 14 [Solanum dulcamara]|uniref:fasciclin-like arabinogalactan protein 14 n=1 Tax=Solanum dulcamara TaxID=45834 RepID=UPI002486794E|nr:fasciclin-like arabinogalactan protein 14 [Solanum dulcamara]
MGNFNTSLVTFFFILILSQAKAFNITTLLDHYSSFSNFNNYLTQTGVAAAINSRQTITLLVVENSDLSPLNGKSQEVLANIMRVHVLLDYYDVQKLQTLPNKTVKVPTLFQTTGQAKHDQGFLNMTDLGTGSISLGSAAKGETLGSNLVKSIASQPYNISIMQISNVIIPLGIDSSTTPSLPSLPPKHSHAHAPAPISRAPTHSPAHSPHRSSAAPAPAPHGLLPNPNAPTADTPADAPSTDTPSADAPTTNGDHESPSASSVLSVSLVFVAMSNVFLVLVI